MNVPLGRRYTVSTDRLNCRCNIFWRGFWNTRQRKENLRSQGSSVDRLEPYHIVEGHTAVSKIEVAKVSMIQRPVEWPAILVRISLPAKNGQIAWQLQGFTVSVWIQHR